MGWLCVCANNTSVSGESDEELTPWSPNKRASMESEKMSPDTMDGGTWIMTSQPYRESERREFSVVLRSQIGYGAHGKVFKAMYGPQRDIVAVKIIRHAAQQTSYVTQEVKMMMELDHPNIVRAFHYVTWEMSRVSMDSECSNAGAVLDAQTWIVQEYCDAGNLSLFISKGYFKDGTGNVDMKAFLGITTPLADALMHMHDKCVLHGDLKCSNVLICTEWTNDTRCLVPKITDFGVSRLVEDVAYVHTQTIGTVSHMPPEMMIDGKLSKPADIYAFGMLMYEIIVGTPPFHGETFSSIIDKVLTNQRPILPSHVDAELSNLITCCWKSLPNKRPTAQKLHEILVGLHASVVE